MNYKVILNKQNTIYKIVRDVDLGGETFTMPLDCTLDFQGGKITNGTLRLQNTKILPQGCVITDYITANIEGNYAVGQCVWNPVLGKPIWWNGSAWVDSTGAVV